MAKMARIAAALSEAIPAIVEAQPRDRELRGALSLSPRIAALLSRIERPYSAGSFRPDLLLGEGGALQICEINARFPTNGYFVSAGSSRAIAAAAAASASASAPKSGGLWRAISAHAEIEPAFLSRFDPSRPIVVLRGREKGGDIHLFAQAARARGFAVECAGPEALAVRDGALFAGSTKVDQALVELHQDELEGLSDAVFVALGNVGVLLNDLRTIFIAHDKRLLAVLSDPRLLARLGLSRELAGMVAPTFIVGSLDRATRAEILAAPERWVVKPNLFGKGAGVVLGKSVAPGELARLLDDPEHAHYVVQRYLPGAEFPIADVRGSAGGVISTRSAHVVGLLLCLDDRFFGPGIFRASSEDVVNVARGGAILIPAVGEQGCNS
jgi:hypothetical protein